MQNLIINTPKKIGHCTDKRVKLMSSLVVWNMQLVFREEDGGDTPGGCLAPPVFVLQEEGEGGGGGRGGGEVGGAEGEMGGKTTSYGLVERVLDTSLPLHAGPGQDDARSLGRHRGEAQTQSRLRVTAVREKVGSEVKFTHLSFTGGVSTM